MTSPHATDPFTKDRLSFDTTSFENSHVHVNKVITAFLRPLFLQTFCHVHTYILTKVSEFNQNKCGEQERERDSEREGERERDSQRERESMPGKFTCLNIMSLQHGHHDVDLWLFNTRY